MSEPDDEVLKEVFRVTGFTEHERVVFIDGRRVVMPVGTPVTRSKVRWGRRPKVTPDEAVEPGTE
jgi:hypothetical protein